MATYKGPFATPPVRIGREVRHTTGGRPATARRADLSWLAPARPFSAGATSLTPPHVVPQRPATARCESMEERICRHLMPDSVTAIAEAALREAHHVKDVDPLCGSTVEIRPLHAVLPRGTRNADFYRARGYQHRMQGNFDQAIDDYHSALKTSPRDFKTLFSLGIACERLGRLQDALAAYAKAASVSPRNPYVHFNTGICYTLREEYKRAIESFSVAIELDVTNVAFYKGRALAYRKAGQYTDAAKDYSTINFLSNEQTDGAAEKDEIARIPPHLRTDEDLHVLMDKTCVFPTCRGLPHDLHQKLCRELVSVTVSPHTVLFKEGDSGHVLFFLLHGKVELFKLPMVKVGDETTTNQVGSIETQLAAFEPSALHRESTFLDTVDRILEVPATPLYTLHTGSEFGSHGRFRQLPRAVNAVATDACELLMLPWSVLDALELAHAEIEVLVLFVRRTLTTTLSQCANVAAFLGKLPIFKYVSSPQLRILAVKTKWIKVPSATVVQVSGQHHEGLLVVRSGTCKLMRHDLLTATGRHLSSSPRLASHSNNNTAGRQSSGNLKLLPLSKGRRTEQHARQAYLHMEHEDDPLHFVYANSTLSSHVLSTNDTADAVVHAELHARDFVGERSFLSNEGNEKSFAKYALVTSSYAELLFVRKADFFTETSYGTRQRVRTNIQKLNDDAAARGTAAHDPKDWARYKAKLVQQIIVDKRLSR
ncbi:hypothetical protein SDRG_07806 [Saprolegnia diclina VS20]|uniref:Cyclic nucleotide-binding domain-containing protein n=1 Tax=Saprolegnia diclina (strain VS20) TaxID=1156394 RepID=T0RPT1_SAPDV|nr:hypothetical protein SDRG_07806 [Saprolegnia diclina VS20]EQC34478.1 hypothetical protein SDRG_07806 [Saprolegnia diclina VS20]|eukprot:XP_008611884.1 hypothetical protein SDRG_07806 [Saprolegnia diclina VS20]